MDNTNSLPDSVAKPVYGAPECWFNSPPRLYFYFLLPMAIIFCFNLVIYIAIVVKFAVLAYQTRTVRSNHREKLLLSVQLIFVFG